MQTAEILLFEALKKIKINLLDSTMGKLLEFLKLMLEMNQTTNLTAITDYQEALIKHLYDALLILTLPVFQNVTKIIDIGSGGGIPAVPLAIVAPEKEIFSLEATQKKIRFQQEAVDKLKLTNFKPIWGRAEELAHDLKYREQYSLVTARAVATCNVLTELTFGFAEIGGTVVFYKGQDYQIELSQAKQAVAKMGGELVGVAEFFLPQNYGARALIELRKVKITPLEYPRKPGIPNKKPF